MIKVYFAHARYGSCAVLYPTLQDAKRATSTGWWVTHYEKH